MYCKSVHGACMQDHRAQLMRASSEGDHETVEALLADGADVNVKDKVSRGEGCEGAPMGARRPWTGCQDCLRRASAQTDCHPYDMRTMQTSL